MTAETFHLVLIKPTKYDDDGYPIHWVRSTMPSNTLASLNGLADDCRKRRILGPDVDIVIHPIDETNMRVRPDKLIKQIRQDNAKAFIGFIGVQSNQYPRAVDLAQPFLDAGLPVCIGGFHVTGCMAMLPEMPPEMVAAQEAGISFFLGEAEEGRLDEVIRDAYQGKLKDLYRYTNDLPTMEDQPIPFVTKEIAERSASIYSSFDLGRGCPFECSFCCIINVQGRKSRFRTADDLEKIIRVNQEMGIYRFFVTDDNFARNKNWEIFADRLIHLRENEGLDFTLIIQVDTLCHKIPNFIEKCVRAGVDQVFIGLENINPDNLAASQKRQNKITDYRNMLLAWKKHPVVLTAGYIIGFPNDTPDSILRDVDVIKRELAIDILSLTILTPLPGSVDHQRAVRDGTWMDSDLNKYDLTHAVTRHPNFKDGELDEIFDKVAERYYSKEHCLTILKRAAALGSDKKMTTANRLLLYGTAMHMNRVRSLDIGYFRLKYRKDRRPGLPIESWLGFHTTFWARTLWTYAVLLSLRWWYIRTTNRMWRDPKRFDYVDEAITPHKEEDLTKMELFTQTRGGTEAVAKFHKIEKIKQDARSGRVELPV